MSEPTTTPAAVDVGVDDIAVLLIDASASAPGVEAALEQATDRVTVETVGDETTALERIHAGDIDCLVGRVPPTAVANWTPLAAVRNEQPHVPVFLILDDWDEDAAGRALEAGATGCVPDSTALHGVRLAARIERAVEQAAERCDLEATTARFRALTENTSFAVITADDDERIKYANDAVETIFGHAADDLIGEPLSTLIPPASHRRHSEAVDRYLRTGERTLDWDWIEVSGRHADGHDVPIGISFGEAVVGGDHIFTAVVRDITDRKRLEREREATLERIGDAFVSIDADWTYTYVNEQAVEFLEHSRDELLGEPLGMAFETVSGTTLERQLETAFAEQTTVSFTEYFGALDSWFEVRAHPSENGLSIFFTNVTDRVRAEAELEENVTALQALYDISTKSDASFDAKLPELLDLGCEYLDLPYGFLTRIDVDERTQTVVESRSNHPLLQTGESCPLANAYCRKTIKTHDLVTVANAPDEGWIGDPAYELFELGSYVGAKVTVDGRIWGTLCFASSEPRGDGGFSEAERTLVKLMAKWVSYETERQQSRDLLERQNDRLQEFTSVVSHDLRNPLNVAQGSLALAREGDQSRLEACEEALERMEQLIDDLLALAEQEETTPELRSVSVRDCATNAWSMVDTGDATLEFDGEPQVRADPPRLQQLLENLFRNAVEHAIPDDESSADLTVTVGDEPDGFYVADDGSGIPEDVRDDIFDIGVTTADDGTGFGLGIVSRVAAAHGWDLEVTASDTGGARFAFTGMSHSHDSQ